MQPVIKTLVSKNLIGLRLKMSLTDNKTNQLWQSFMPRRKEIKNTISGNLYSMQVYPPLYFTNFNPSAEFEKWAAAEVSGFDIVPAGLETILLSGGLYAVFLYKGAADKAPQTFQYIFGDWLPNSKYIPDNRPHFELPGEKYKKDDPESEEEIWIPIR
jgi:AraC family transcriptional regulator